MKTITVICLTTILSLSAVASPYAQGGSVALRAIAEQEIEVVNEQGETEVRRVEAGKITPGDEVVYSIVYENVGEAPADNVIITNPVPEHMSCLDVTDARSMRITASVDGGTNFDATGSLVVVEEDGSKRPAELADYTHIRWTLTDPLAPGAIGRVEFRAVLQ